MDDSLTIKKSPLQSSKTISVAKVSFVENDMMVFEFFNDITLGVSEIKELAIASHDLSGGAVPILSLVVTGERNNMSTEAFAYNIFKELNITQRTIAEAVVIQNIATRIMANFYYKVVPRPFPVKVFENKEKAITWLSMKKSEEQ